MNVDAPSIFVIMGATGDLATKKIIPSLWHLFGHDLLPSKLRIIGFSWDTLSDEQFQEFITQSLENHGGVGESAEKLERFFDLFSYHEGAFEDGKAYETLVQKITEIESEFGMCPNKLFYLAVPPSSYEQIFKNLAAVGLNSPCSGEFGWNRILIEKPFGTDLESAKKLQILLSSYFSEDQIYRIDHYFFKEIVQGIENFRFSNNLFENAWDNTMIESVHIRLHESIGVEDRGSFYDSIGTLRDVGQNHILTMLAALTMQYPKNLSIDSMRDARANVVADFEEWTQESIQKQTYHAQYAGYQDIDGVKEDSTTETYFALKTGLQNNQWKGIPIYMEAGKRMGEARKEIVLTLKHPDVCLLCQAGEHGPNKIIFRLEPNDEIVIHFWTKKPGFDHVLEERVFSFFLYEKETRVQYVEEYAKILHAAMAGNQSLFISVNEVMASWKFTDPIIQEWNNDASTLAVYEPGNVPVHNIFESTSKMTAEPVGEIGIVGLGKMGAGLAGQLLEKGWSVAGFNADEKETKKLETEGLRGAYSLQELVDSFASPRTIWLMVPHQVVDTVLEELVPLLQEGDTVIDGGNSPYKESMRRGKELAEKKIRFLDVGVSGGPGGARHGACVMVGGDKKVYESYDKLFDDLSIEDGYGYMGESGAGHFVKMVHNGIEYGMMQAIGEGFEVIKKSPFSPNLYDVAQIYNHGSVITSSLVGWLVGAYKKYGNELQTDECCSGRVSHSGEGQWTVDAAKEMDVPVLVIEDALEFRKKSRDNPSYTGQVVSALRHEFGGHDARKNNNK